MTTETKTAFLYSNGCLEGALDLNLYENFLRKNGWTIITDSSKADLILLSTCSTPKIKENFAVEKIKYFQRKKKKNGKLVVCGCLPAINPDRLSKYFQGDSFGPQNQERLADIIQAQNPSITETYSLNKQHMGDLNYPNKIKRLLLGLKKHHIPVPEYLLKRFTTLESSDMFYIKVSQGCLGNCSYCGIKIAKGHLKSKPITTIVEEFKQGLKEGYSQFVLSGDDIGCYGIDHGITLIDLLTQLVNQKENFKIILRFIEPEWLIKYFDDLVQIFQTDKISSLCSPIQSGSNRILKLMNRKYTAEQALHCLDYIRKNFPKIMLRTHFIVGFPSETEHDFKLSLQAIDRIDFDLIIPAVYTDYPNTASNRLNQKISTWKKKKRFSRMLLRILLNVFFNRLIIKQRLLSKRSL